MFKYSRKNHIFQASLSEGLPFASGFKLCEPGGTLFRDVSSQGIVSGKSRHLPRLRCGEHRMFTRRIGTEVRDELVLAFVMSVHTRLAGVTLPAIWAGKLFIC